MDEIIIFNNPDFGEIRTIMIDGEPWFVGNDVAGILKYKDKYSALKKNVDEEDKRLCPVGSTSGTQETTVINESGLYSLIFGSKLESAKKFKRWVTSEVLPQIRRTGSYGTPKLPENPMELLELHYEAIKQVDGKAEKALTGIEELKEQFNTFEKSLPLLPNEADEVSNAVKKRVIEVLGGKTAPAYKDRKICQRVFIDAYRELKRNFNVGRYKDIKREQKSQAVEIAGRYEPPLYLKEQIEQANAQIKLNLDEQEDRNEQ